MEARGITNVFAPNPVRAASSSRVLTAEWVDGVSLDAAWRTDALAPAKAGNIQALTALCLNAYLTMMLDSGVVVCMYIVCVYNIYVYYV